MLEAIKRMLAGHPEAAPQAGAPSDADVGPLHVAACALLLELAHADGEFTPEERRHIEEALVRHFNLTAQQSRELMGVAEARRSGAVELYQFTSLLTSRYDEGQRLLLAELLWRVVYADGQLSQHEEYLMRKLAHLLDLRPGYLSVARQRAGPPAASTDATAPPTAT